MQAMEQLLQQAEERGIVVAQLPGWTIAEQLPSTIQSVAKIAILRAALEPVTYFLESSKHAELYARYKRAYDELTSVLERFNEKYDVRLRVEDGELVSPGQRAGRSYEKLYELLKSQHIPTTIYIKIAGEEYYKDLEDGGTINGLNPSRWANNIAKKHREGGTANLWREGRLYIKGDMVRLQDFYDQHDGLKEREVNK